MKKINTLEIIKKRKYYYAISGSVLIIGLISLIIFGLKFSIEFTGGSRLQLASANPDSISKNVADVFSKNNLPVVNISEEQGIVTVRTQAINQDTREKIISDLKNSDSSIREESFETVGAVIGSETKVNALKAVGMAILAIAIYVSFVFRSVSRPVSSWKFGVVTIVTLAHDILITIGIFSLLGKFTGVEVDTLFITALLTALGFSVHDTIVVFDRIREHLKKNDAGITFEQLVNNSVLETINRSFNTSLTVVFVLLALLLFSQGSLFWFVVALLIGIVTGTYSSIFIASPLLVEWAEFDKKRSKKN